MFKYLSVLSFLSLAFPVHAQMVEDWQINCSESSCTVARTAIASETGQRSATFFAAIEKATDTTTIGVIAPLGVALEPGVRLVFGDTSVIAEMSVCFPDGCRAIVKENAVDVTKSESVDVRYFPFGSKGPLAVLVALDGIENALDEARKQLGEN